VILWTMVRVPENAPSLKFLLKLTCSAGFLALAAPIGLASDAAKVAALRLFGDLSITDSSALRTVRSRGRRAMDRDHRARDVAAAMDGGIERRSSPPSLCCLPD
jgi:hypothetical protein